MHQGGGQNKYFLRRCNNQEPVNGMMHYRRLLASGIPQSQLQAGIWFGEGDLQFLDDKKEWVLKTRQRVKPGSYGLWQRQSSNLAFLTPVQCSQSCRLCFATRKHYGWALWAYTAVAQLLPLCVLCAGCHDPCPSTTGSIYAALTLPEAFWLVGS